MAVWGYGKEMRNGYLHFTITRTSMARVTAHPSWVPAPGVARPLNKLMASYIASKIRSGLQRVMNPLILINLKVARIHDSDSLKLGES